MFSENNIAARNEIVAKGICTMNLQYRRRNFGQTIEQLFIKLCFLSYTICVLSKHVFLP